MAKVVRYKLAPGETMFGGGPGVMLLNSAKWQRKPSPSETDRSALAPQPFDIALEIAERQMAQEKLDAMADGPHGELSNETAVEDALLALDRKILAERAEPNGKESQ